MLVRLIHLDKPHADLPLLWALSSEVHIATSTEMILASPKFAYLNALFGNRRNPVTSRLHFALASVEDTILTHVHTEIARQTSGTMTAFMFDGGIVAIPSEEKPLLQRVLQHVGTQHEVVFKMENFPSE